MTRKREILGAEQDADREYERGYADGVAALAQHYNQAKAQNLMLQKEIQRLQRNQAGEKSCS